MTEKKETATEKKNPLLKMLDDFSPNEINKLPRVTNQDKQAPKARCNECQGYHANPSFHLDYVGHAALTKRLLEVDLYWTWEPFAIDADGLPKLDAMGGLWIRLTVCGVTRIGYGDSGNSRGNQAIKEAIGDALRNAGMRFGAALDLWHKGDLFEAGEERGNPDQEENGKIIGSGTPPPNEPKKTEPTKETHLTDVAIKSLQGAYGLLLECESFAQLDIIVRKNIGQLDFEFPIEGGEITTLRNTALMMKARIEAKK